ncbi:MAG TPA: hypothetical protein DDW27_03740 [Bacteroidales bacterium]|nr:hypothetical protein [Bacteroidales bacterium]
MPYSSNDFEILLERIVKRKSSADAHQAWDELHQLAGKERQRLFIKCIQQHDIVNSNATLYLYQFGYWYPDETLNILKTVAQDGSLLAWQILCAQLSRQDIYSDGERCHPFKPIENAAELEIKTAAVDVIQQFIIQNLLNSDLRLVSQIAEALSRAPSLSALEFLTDIVSNRKYDTDRRLILCVGVKCVAEALYTKLKQRDWISMAQKLAVIVTNNEEDFNIRGELAYVFLFFPLPEGISAVRSLIENTKKTGFGSVYLADLDNLLKDLEKCDVTSDNDILPHLTADEIIQAIMGFSKKSIYSYGRWGEALSQGSTLCLETGDTKTFHYSKEVIDKCIGIIHPFDKDDPEWCDRYVKLLVEAVCFNGPPEAMFQCIVAGASRSLNKVKLFNVLNFLQLAFNNINRLYIPSIIERFGLLGELGILSGQKAQNEGQTDLAISFYELTAKLMEGRIDEHFAGALMSLGILYSTLEDWPNALTYLERARPILVQIEDQENLATCLMEIGVAEQVQGNYEASRHHLESALSICEPLESATHFTALPHCLSHLADLGIEDGSLSKSEAIELIDRAINLARERKDFGLENLLLHKKEDILGLFKIKNDFDHNVRRMYSQIEASQGDDFWAAVNSELREASELDGRANFQFEEIASDLRYSALCLYIRAYIRLTFAEEFEVLRHTIDNDIDVKAPKSANHIISRIIDILITRGDINWAMEFADRSKSRSLIRLCQLSRFDVLLNNKSSVPSYLITEINETTKRLSSLIHSKGLSDSEEARNIHLRLKDLISYLPAPIRNSFGIDQAINDYMTLRRELKNIDDFTKMTKEYSESKESPLLDLYKGWLPSETLPEIASFLNPDERLIEYYLDNENDGHIFILDPDGVAHHAYLNVSEEKLISLISQLIPNSFVLDNSKEPSGCTAMLSELYDILIRPINNWICSDTRKVKRLVIVPHGPLFNLPFAPLWNKERRRYLIEDFELTVIPNGGFLHLLQSSKRQLPKKFKFAGFYNASNMMEDLPETERELKEIISILSSDSEVIGIATGKEMTRQRFIHLCNQADIIHYAGHAVFIPDSPMDSYLPLAAAESGTYGHEDRLSCSEMIEQLHLKSTIFFLSGCESGRSEMRGQMEIAGFLRTAFLCGASTVIFSLWPLPDTRETVSIVSHFYRNLIFSGESCSNALRNAMLSMRNMHPWFWAGFQMSGIL